MAYSPENKTVPTHVGDLGDHPVGGAVGAAVGGALGAAAVGAAQGATIGTVMAGAPGTLAGTAVGAVVGGVAGALAGKGVAQMINPTTEDAYWRDAHTSRPYVEKGAAYDTTYGPAYRYGVNAFTQYGGRPYDEVRDHLANGWDAARGESSLTWDKAGSATQDAYDRLYNQTNQNQAKN